MSNNVDIANMRFGRLLAISPTDQRSRTRGILWKCVCDCGHERLATATALRRGLSSCGCLQRDVARETGKRCAKDLTGKAFGRLTALRVSPRKDGRLLMWECQCKCGTVCSIRTSHLLSGAVKSCGCLQKEIARNVNTIHGLSKTRHFRAHVNRCRKERKLIFDSSWTIDMEIELNKIFNACVICGSTITLSVDHLLPLELGYGLFSDNALILCRSCNSSKNDNYITDLPPEIRRKLIDASCEFQDYLEWQMYAGE